METTLLTLVNYARYVSQCKVTFHYFFCSGRPKRTSSGQFKWKGSAGACIYFSTTTLQIPTLNLVNRKGRAERLWSISRAFLTRTRSENSSIPFKNWLVGPDRLDKWKTSSMSHKFCFSTLDLPLTVSVLNLTQDKFETSNSITQKHVTVEVLDLNFRLKCHPKSVY